MRTAHLGEAKVTQLGEALRIDEDVLGLEISVHNVVVVQVLQGQDDGGNVVPGQILRHALHTRIMKELVCYALHTCMQIVAAMPKISP